jgi:hypothetical protein
MKVKRDHESPDDVQQAHRPRKRGDRGATPDRPAGTPPIARLVLGLQRTAGNAATTDLLSTVQRHPAAEDDAPIPAELLKT